MIVVSSRVKMRALQRLQRNNKHKELFYNDFPWLEVTTPTKEQ